MLESYPLYLYLLDNIEIIILEPGIPKIFILFSLKRVFIELLKQLSNKSISWDQLDGRERIFSV